ncbi:MAG: type IV pilus assembly protein PilM, partial [Candidatus Paceibacterota bacterium]
MRWSLLKLIPKKFLGIDIGTSSIKIVEISRWGERKKLENYGEVSADILYEKPFRTFEKSTLTLSAQDVSKAIKGVLEEIKTKTKQCIISIPDFSSFFTNFELPPMTKEEFDQAIRYEARQHIPLPLGEVTLDWQILKGEVSDSQKSKLKILLVAVPNEIINQYKEIATLSQLELVALEAEVFGLSRSLIGEDDKGVISIIDIGAQSTTCSIIDKKVLKTSHSFDIGGNELTDRISKALSVDHKIASDFKKKYGISTREGLGLTIQQNIKDILLPLIDIIIREVDKIFINFQQTEGKEVQKIIIAGG